jgi:predicted cupin superfamily sugar epimerase
MNDAQHWIEQLALERHPEGGYYRESYRSGESIAPSELPNRYSGARQYATAIYYLLEGEDFSAFHRILTDEIWHYYAGCETRLHLLDTSGTYTLLKLGANLGNGEKPQVTVPAGTWFAAEPSDKHAFTLAGCTLSPGFDFDDFEMGGRQLLCGQFPAHADLIQRLTRSS